MEHTPHNHLRLDVQAHFEQKYGRPLVFEFLEIKPISNDRVLFDVKISKEGVPLAHYRCIAGYLNQSFSITKLVHQNASRV